LDSQRPLEINDFLLHTYITDEEVSHEDTGIDNSESETLGTVRVFDLSCIDALIRDCVGIAYVLFGPHVGY